jgi:hypothetical protein
VEKGKWTLLDVNKDGAIALPVQSTTAVRDAPALRVPAGKPADLISNLTDNAYGCNKH